MKRLLLIIWLIPSLCFGTYTEFYCQNGGSNVNAGSTNNNTAAYTSTSGNWVQATNVFTPTDSSNPSSTVNVGDFASVYVNGASVAVFIGRITAVTNATNGTITVAGTFAGAAPANQTGTATIKVGGAWLGPNAASGFPFTLSSFGNQKDTSSHIARVNVKNDQTYSLTASFTPTNSGSQYVVQGYSSSVGDGGKSTFDGGTSTSSLVAQAGPAGTVWQDLIFSTSITSGSGTVFVEGSQVAHFIRCVFKGSRGIGLQANATGGTSIIECEAYDNNKGNSSGLAGFALTNNCFVLRSIAHDNTGSNTSGFSTGGGGIALVDCISDTNGKYGFAVTGSAVNGPITVQNCDFYNNGSDGINVISTNANQIWIENSNFIKNTGAGINNASTTQGGFVYNCGYGAGTQANGSADTINNLTKTGTVTYASNVTPWVDPANGDFRINLPAAYNVGRGSFQQTQGYSSPNTVGYPDIGVANHNDTCSGTGPCQTSSANAQ